MNSNSWKRFVLGETETYRGMYDNFCIQYNWNKLSVYEKNIANPIILCPYYSLKIGVFNYHLDVRKKIGKKSHLFTK